MLPAVSDAAEASGFVPPFLWRVRDDVSPKISGKEFGDPQSRSWKPRRCNSARKDFHAFQIGLAISGVNLSPVPVSPLLLYPSAAQAMISATLIIASSTAFARRSLARSRNHRSAWLRSSSDNAAAISGGKLSVISRTRTMSAKR